MPEVLSATQDQVAVQGTCCHWGHTDLGDLNSHCSHGDIQKQAAFEGHIWVYGSAAARVCVNVMAHIITGGQGTMDVNI